MNNILIVFDSNDKKATIAYPVSVSEEDALKDFKELYKEKVIKKHYYAKNTGAGMDVIQNFSFIDESGQLVIDNNLFVQKRIIDRIRESRNGLLSALDVPFMRALEDDNENGKAHIRKLKNFLRAIPRIADFHLSDLEMHDMLNYNPFCNIFDIMVVKGGSGYQSAPEVHIEPPRGQYVGVSAKAMSFIEGGKVIRMEIVDPGCGYSERPQVSVAKPDDEDGTQCFAVCSPPQNNLDTTYNAEDFNVNISI